MIRRLRLLAKVFKGKLRQEFRVAGYEIPISLEVVNVCDDFPPHIEIEPAAVLVRRISRVNCDLDCTNILDMVNGISS